MTELIVGRRL